ncbi:MAG: LacI family DNA-binding transcriptional regulator [Eubacteriales bacterium]|nr:LacI family DNA-binding transcriptional regulator [Eubacteriales bacterium]
MKRVGIKDVAREAGVSASTVSYVLNRKASQTISAETTARVWETVERLHYVPNLNARSLSSRKTNLIGVVIPQTEPGKEFMFSNPFYGELLSAIEYRARRSGYHLLLSGPEPDQSYINIARNRGVDGIIIVGSYPSKSLDELHELSVPVVLVDTYVKDPVFHTIGIDDRQGGKLATQYLLGRGHRKIAFVSGPITEQGVMLKRFLGYVDALGEAGIPLNEKQLYLGTVDFESALASVQEMEHRGNGETAAFAAADILGMGLIKGLHRMGKAVPEAMSVVGFDDVNLAQMADPSLTTIRQDIAAKGKIAVEIILDVQAGEEEKQEHILPISLVERDSVRML